MNQLSNIEPQLNWDSNSNFINVNLTNMNSFNNVNPTNMNFFVNGNPSDDNVQFESDEMQKNKPSPDSYIVPPPEDDDQDPNIFPQVNINLFKFSKIMFHFIVKMKSFEIDNIDLIFF